MPSPQKIKGNSFEYQLCDILKEAFGGNWQRVPNSGAATGGKNTSRKGSMDHNQIRLMKGDIIPAAHMPKIVVEAKFYKEFAFHLLVRSEVKQLDMWIDQTITSVDQGDVWFLCIKINRKSTFIVFDKKHINEFKLENYCNYKEYIFTDLETFIRNNIESIKNLTADS